MLSWYKVYDVALLGTLQLNVTWLSLGAAVKMGAAGAATSVTDGAATAAEVASWLNAATE
jgi:hypothetical protein